MKWNDVRPMTEGEFLEFKEWLNEADLSLPQIFIHTVPALIATIEAGGPTPRADLMAAKMAYNEFYNLVREWAMIEGMIFLPESVWPSERHEWLEEAISDYVSENYPGRVVISLLDVDEDIVIDWDGPGWATRLEDIT